MMSQSSPNNPLPVVTTLERLSKAQMNGLRGHYHSVLLYRHPNIVSTDKFYHALMVGIFRFLGSDDQRYQQCFSMCMSLCRTTKVLQVTSWSRWNGFSTVLRMMEKAERLTRHTNMLHCPSAPYLVVAIALQQVILHNSLGENDKVSLFFFGDFDCHNKAATAIYFYEMNNRQEILTLDQAWHATNFGPQRAPNRMLDQLTARTLDQRMPTPRDHVYREVIELKDEQLSVKRESPAANHASEFKEERREEAMPVPAPVQVQMPVPTSMLLPTSVQLPMPMPMPVQASMPTPVSGPTQALVPMPMPAMVKATLKEVFRGDVMMQLQPLLDRLKSENWNGVIQRDIMQVLTDKNVRVLPGLAKNMLNMWATRSQNAMLLSWLEQARDDIDVFQWTERYIEPAPSTWTKPPSVHGVFHDLDAMITGIPQLTIRGPLQAKMKTLRDIFDQQEKSHKDEMLFRVDSLQMDIAKLHDHTAESKQTDGHAVSESAVIDNDTTETDQDVVVIIETDEDDEDLEGERKKKKRKGEKKVPKKGKREKKDKKNGEIETKKEKKKAKKTKGGDKKKRSHEDMMEED